MATDPRTAAIVLAAGDGKRLKSDLPKVMHLAAGRPLLVHVLSALAPLDLTQVVVVVSARKDEIAAGVADAALGLDIDYAIQETPLGTGDAARVGLSALRDEIEEVIVVSGDSPLVLTSTLERMREIHRGSSAAVTLLTGRATGPDGYGRVIRNGAGDIERIVEDRDATGDERAVDEINAGAYVFDRQALEDVLPKLGSDNAQREYYLTDTVTFFLADGHTVAGFEGSAAEAEGVNSRAHLAHVTKELRRRACERWMDEGVTIVDPDSTFIDPAVEIGRDAVIYPFTFLEGATTIGPRAEIGPQARIVDSAIAEDAIVTFAVVRGSEIGPAASVGPFASLRAGTRLERGARAGTFVETKNTSIGEDSKASHLAYLGDAKIGRGVNVGAGTITCNWDGTEKHETVIDDDAYIGSDTMLVAPAHIGKRAATGAGSVVRGDVPDDALAVGAPARIIERRGDKMGKKSGTRAADRRE